MKGFKESDLYQPIKDWLEKQGFRVYAEVMFQYSTIDVVGRKGDEIISVELKRSLSQSVVRQAMLAGNFSDSAYAAVPTNPRSLEFPKRIGIGVLQVRDHGRVVTLLEPTRSKPLGQHKANLLKMMDEGWEWGDLGGVPNIKGEGPARDCMKRVEEYRAIHPKATWKDIFANVPNHYHSYKSMYGALMHSCGNEIALPKNEGWG